MIRTLCTVPEIWCTATDGWTDGRTDRQMDRWTDRKSDLQRRMPHLKINLTFYRDFENIFFFKENFLHAMTVLGYLSKLKRSLGLAIGAHFYV